MPNPETKLASPAVAELCRLHRELVAIERERIAAAAFATDSLDPADGWLLDVGRGLYFRPEPQQESAQ